MIQTGYSSDFQMGSSFCEFISFSFMATLNTLQVLFVLWNWLRNSARLKSRDAAGDISERDVVCTGAVAGARQATSGPVSVGERAGAEARTA